MELFIHYDGKIMPANTPVVPAASRGFRYADGLFETLRVVKGRLVLRDLHFGRLFHGLSVLKFQPGPHFTAAKLESDILRLCDKMSFTASARIRLNITRGPGGLYDPESHHPHVVIEAWPLELPRQLNENGLVVDIYEEARKHYDVLANLKSNNYLPYVLAALHVKENRLNDCLLLNTEGRICDATIANVFWVKDGSIYTPPLTEGGIAGVMRQFLLQETAAGPHPIQEAPLTPELLATADELFLTNAIQGIKWVGQLRDTRYGNTMAAALYQQYILPLWA
ncbi:aminotransferase class IV [Paraflavitalea pollutisoli]|uniref:aminotransferase class IV n=1 Tax=Paraflavitalea pollutisoli TaxID=3034143 RepID=UPI0023ED5467|nr:aminotransferase class IV [Paraflavitalea sp. H1-2-19X]